MCDARARGRAIPPATSMPSRAAAASTARRCAQFYRVVRDHAARVTAFSQGVNQSSAAPTRSTASSTATCSPGRIGEPGMGPFSLTGQPNAMGGREVGGLANMLAAHMDLDDPAQREPCSISGTARASPQRPGLKAVDLFDAIHRRAASRPCGSWPPIRWSACRTPTRCARRCALRARRGLRLRRRHRHHRLRACAAAGAALGREGRHGHQLRAPHLAPARLPAAAGRGAADWWIVCRSRAAHGIRRGFDFTARRRSSTSTRASWRRQRRRRAPSTSGTGSMTAAPTTRWSPCSGRCRARVARHARLFADGRFPPADGRARFVATAPRAPMHALDEDYPLVLNTGRMRDQWHTMTRTGKSPRLSAHMPEPFVDMHPQDALSSGCATASWRAWRRAGAAWWRACAASGDCARGDVFVPIHWSDRSRPMRASARWSIRWSTRSRASRSSSTRRPASSRSSSPGMAWC